MRFRLLLLLVVLAVAFPPAIAQEESAEAAAAPAILDANAEGVTPPVLKERVEPTYPEKAGDLGITGSVRLKTLVKADGTVKVVEVIRSVPEGKGFEEASTAAVEKWRYEPAQMDGKAIDVYLVVQLRVTSKPNL